MDFGGIKCTGYYINAHNAAIPILVMIVNTEVDYVLRMNAATKEGQKLELICFHCLDREMDYMEGIPENNSIMLDKIGRMHKDIFPDHSVQRVIRYD